MPEISQTGDQMLSVLEAVAQHGPVSAAEVARICDINRTVAHRLLTTLALRAYVRRGEGGYTVGPAVPRLAQAADFDLRRFARPVMDALAAESGETVVLHAIDELDAVVIAQATGTRHLVRVEHRPGSRHPLRLGASGLALLAFQGEKLSTRAAAGATDPAALTGKLALVRQQGFAMSHDELQQGVHGLAAPVITADGRCVASLAILVPAARASGLADLSARVRGAARAISDLL